MAETPADDAPPRHVEIKMVAREEDRALKAVLTELLDRLQVTTRFTSVPDLEAEEMWAPHPGAATAVARAWIDMREPGIVTLYLTGDKQDRVLVRQVPLVRRLDEVAREEIAHIVEAAVDELLRGGQIGVVKKHAPELPPSVNLGQPLPEPPLRLDIGFGYAVQGWADKRDPLHGPAAFASLVKKGGAWRPGVWASAELRFSATIDDGLFVSTQLNQGALRLLFVLDRSLSNRWLIRGGVGGGVDVVDIQPTTSRSTDGKTVTLEAGQTRLIPMLRGLAVARYAFTNKSEFFFGASVDLSLVDTRYVRRDVEPNPGMPGSIPTTTPLLEPWQVRPMALIGITADVLAY